MSQSAVCWLRSRSARTYQTQASQWAASENNTSSSVRIMLLYCVYRSIFCSSRTSRSSRVSFSR